jgi:hypothetical protein
MPYGVSALPACTHQVLHVKYISPGKELLQPNLLRAELDGQRALTLAEALVESRDGF